MWRLEIERDFFNLVKDIIKITVMRIVNQIVIYLVVFREIELNFVINIYKEVGW